MTLRLDSLRRISIVLALFAALGLVYSVATPIFEASDEVSHYAVIQQIVNTGELPVQRPDVETRWEQEGSQPPLYYELMSLVARGFDTSDYTIVDQRNPHALPGDPSLDANRNLVIHSAAEDFPWRGTALVVHVLRLISIGLGAITIGCSYALARRLFPARSSIPIGAAALIAFNPMFLFIAASVNNDNLVIALSSLALYLTVVIYQEDQLDRAAWLRRTALGVVLGAAALTKISGLMLLPIVGVMLTLRHLQRREWRVWLITGGLLIVLVAAIAGWWYLRNAQLYGEPLGLETMVAIAGPRTTPRTLGQLVAEFDGFRYSYWALFGAVNILTMPIAYTIFDAFVLAALMGFAGWLWVNRRREQAWLMLLLASYALLVFVGVMRWTLMTPASQGRLMFPAIAVIALILWTGWETLWQSAECRMQNAECRMQNAEWVKWTLPAFMLIVATIAPVRDIAPTYAGPIMLAPDQVPATIARLDVDFGLDLRLIGYSTRADAAREETTEFTLYWQCLRQPEADLSVFAIVYGRGLSEVGKRDAYPYRGLFGTRQCQAGQVFADPYRVRLQAAAQAVRPTVLRVQIGLKDRARAVELEPTVKGQAISAVIFTAGWLPPDRPAPAPSIEARYRLGDAIELLGYDAPQIDLAAKVIRYRLYWRAVKDGVEDFTVFAHLLDERGAQIGQGDSQPFDGDFPTSLWRAGETFVEERSLPITTDATPTQATLALGLYRLAVGTRLTVIDAAGQAAPDGQILVGVHDQP
jgi:4-amino-4-deoxy-L-arabinose transferase-like glycosyltransferase